MSGQQKPPDGCPGCNPTQVMPFLHGRNIHVEELPEEAAHAPEAVVCERCKRAWILMPRTGDNKTPVA